MPKTRGRDVAEAVKSIVEAVPVYEDAIQPVAKQIGTALETVGKAVNVALAPVGALVWGFDRVSDFVQKRLAEKLQDVPPERIQTPNILVAGPTLEALRFAGNEDSLRELYANLLATSLDSQTAKNAHPSFVNIIRDISPDEAKIIGLLLTKSAFPVVDLRAKTPGQPGYKVVISNFSLIGRQAGCSSPDLTPNYLDNLCRLGLFEIPAGIHLEELQEYTALESDAALAPFKAAIKEVGRSVEFGRKLISITTFGKQFCETCVLEGAPPWHVLRPPEPFGDR